MNYGDQTPRQWLFAQFRAEFIESGKSTDKTVSREVYADLFEEFSGNGMLLLGRVTDGADERDCLVVSAPGGAVRVFHE